MKDERTPELAEFEADFRRTRDELLDDDIPDLGAFVRRRVHAYWDERYAYGRVADTLPAHEVSATTDEEARFITDLQRTRQELTAGETLDLDSIVANGARAYWDRRQSQTPASEPIHDAVPATAALLRASVTALTPSFDSPVLAPVQAAAWSARPTRQLILGFAAVVTSIVGLSTFLAAMTDVGAPLFRITGPGYVFDQHTRFAITSAVILVAIGVGTFAMFRQPSFRRWSIVMGTVAGSAVLSIGGIAYVDASRAVMEVEELGTRELLLSLEQSDPETVPPPITAGVFYLETTRLSEASRGLKGELVGHVSSPREARLEWHVGGDVVNRARFFVGTVQRVENGEVVLLSGEKTFRFPAEPERPPTVGAHFVAQVDASGKLEWWHPTNNSASFAPLLRRGASRR
jgi:hypothetical protein